MHRHCGTTIEHQGRHLWTSANQRWDQMPGRSQRLLLGQPHPPWMSVSQRKCIYGGPTLDVDRHYIGSVTATTHQEKGIITLSRTPFWIECTFGFKCLFSLLYYFVSRTEHSFTQGILSLACIRLSVFSVGCQTFSNGHASLCFAGDTCIPWNAAIQATVILCLFSVRFSFLGRHSSLCFAGGIFLGML